MKKGLLLSSVLVAVLILTTACGGESKLKCTTSVSGVDINYNVGFKGNTIDTMDFAYTMDLSDYDDSTISLFENQDFCSEIKAGNDMKDYKDAFKDCNKKIEDKKLKVTASFEVNKIAKSLLDKIQSPESAKKELESQNFKCTIEK